MEAVEMFERASMSAAALARSMDPEQLGLPTPCTEWDVRALLEHMAGGATYLLDALGAGEVDGVAWPDARLVDEVVTRSRAPGATERRCVSPAGFEWSVGDAAAGTAMDQLIHAWDLAVALGADRTVDAELTSAIVAMFLPHMPEVGRQAGFVGPAVAVAADASPLEVLLGAMGRDPRR